VVVSEPVTPPLTAERTVIGSQATRSAAVVSYVSFPPGTATEATAASIRNLSTGFSVDVVLVEGGLDPVAVPASVGDTIEVTLLNAEGTVDVLRSVVPLRLPPKITRTRPRRGRTAVPINLSIAVVFTEPVDPATVSSQTVRLESGVSTVSGTLVLRPDGLVAEIVPDQLLSHATEYRIIVDTGVRDLSQDSIEATFTSEFTTAPSTLSGKIAFASNRAGHSELYVMDADGSNAGRITYGVNGGFSTTPAVSPDGRKIAFSVLVDGPAGPIEDWTVYVMNVDGTELRKLGLGWRPTWSPDGSRIAFAPALEDNLEIYVADADGTGLINISQSPAWDSNPAWSPDGSRIAFATNRDGGGGPQIYVVDPDGSNLMPLTQMGNLPAWSPDGSQLAIDRSSDIYLMNPDGTGLQNLTLGRAFPATIPAWSPDGNLIAFQAGPAGAHGLYVIDVNGEGLTLLSNGPGDSWPSWSP
jgi:Tol biopolymer transport system component